MIELASDSGNSEGKLKMEDAMLLAGRCAYLESMYNALNLIIAGPYIITVRVEGKGGIAAFSPPAQPVAELLRTEMESVSQWLEAQGVDIGAWLASKGTTSSSAKGA